VVEPKAYAKQLENANKATCFLFIGLQEKVSKSYGWVVE
jgi:hypothetical protein